VGRGDKAQLWRGWASPGLISDQPDLSIKKKY